MDLVRSRVHEVQPRRRFFVSAKKRFATEEPGLAAAGGQLEEKFALA
jgi:hypothetical protein